MEALRYRVDLAAHRQHLVRVTVVLPGDVAAERLVLPVWTPGSYVVRDYVHHLQCIEAYDAEGEPLRIEFDGRSAWHLAPGTREVTLEFYANDLTVRSNHVDDHHALLVGAATFPFVEGARARRHEVTIAAPDGWRVWSLLPGDTTYVADDYDHLVDSAFEVGDHAEVAFDVHGIPHTFVWAGHTGTPDLERIAADTTRLAQAATEVFGGDLPVASYRFLCVSWDQGGGGLEHRDGAVLMVPATTFTLPDRYRSFQGLVAHEYFHLWNVKRLTPAALIDLDYERPVHSPSLWVAEGWTAYYDDLLPLRAGLWSVKQHLDIASQRWQTILDTPGRHLQSVRQASHEAWTKYYVADENTPNSSSSYYTHGAALAWCLDLLIRRERPGSDGLDDALRLLWDRFGDERKGYVEADVEEAIADAAGTDLSGFFTHHVDGTEDPPLPELLGTVGLRATTERDDETPPAPHLGVLISEDDDGVTLRTVLRDGPAWAAGVTGGDRLVAIDGARVQRGGLGATLAQYDPGATVEVALFRGPRLLTVPVTLGDPAETWRITTLADATDAQRSQFERWAGRAWEPIEGP